MDTELLVIAALIAIVWFACKQVRAAIEDARQIEIARRGASCQAKIVGIQRPFFLDTCTRLYFDYLPPGSATPIRACHVAHRPPDALRTALPAAGTVVTVRYLPERPKRAVIARLIAPGESA